MEVSLDGEHVDLHGEYDCIDIKYADAGKQLDFLFKKIDSNNEVVLRFNHVTIEIFNFNFSLNEESRTLDLFYRGRFLLDGKLHDSSEIKGLYFYVNFLEDTAFELFAKEVLLIKQEQ